MTETNQPNQNLHPGGIADLAGTPVSRLGYGAMQLPGPGVWGPPRDRDAALAVLRRAVALGVNHIDTAEYYGRSVANELIQAALHPYPDGLALVSKVGAFRDDQGHWLPAQRPDQLRQGVEDNLRTLRADRLTAVNLRRMDGDSREELPPEAMVALDDQLAEMVRLRDEGKIGGIGLSNCSRAQLEQALPAGIVCVQNAYSLLDRSSEPVLELCRANGIAWVPFFPLGSAFPHQPKVTDRQEVRDAASALGATPAQVGLAWLLAHDAHTLLIPGTSSVGHLEENLATADVHLDASTMATLDALGS